MNLLEGDNYKLSQYCYALRKGSSLILYNSLYGINNILKIDDIDNLSELYKLSANSKAILKEYGYLIEKEIDESKIVENSLEKLKYDDMTARVVILTTMECNFECKYCYERHKKERLSLSSQEDILRVIKKILDEEKIRVLNVSWFGGEPLLATEVINSLSLKIMELCKSYGVFYVASITTNGYLLNVKTMRELMRLHIYSVQVTVDGNEKTHNIQRPLVGGGGSYSKVINNIQDIQKEIKSSMLQVIIRMNIGCSCSDKIKDYIFELRELLGFDKRFLIMPMPISNWGGEYIEQVKDDLMSSRELKDVYKEILTIPEIHAYFLNTLNENSMCDMNNRNSFIVKPNGRITKCTIELDNDFSIEEYNNCFRNIEEDSRCKTCFLYGWCKQLVCPGKTKKGNCPIQKSLIDDILENIPSSKYEVIPNTKNQIFKYKEK